MKFAAIGVRSVPQNPAVRARAEHIIGSPPCANTKGIPIPTVITENAAKPLPIIAVNNAIPTQYAITPAKGLPCGITPDINPEITSPTPASVNTAPNDASNFCYAHM